MLLVRGEAKALAEAADQPLHLVTREIGGGAAAEMELDDRPRRIVELGVQIGFTEDVVDVLPGDARRARHDLVAAAVVAQGMTERDMRVDGQRSLALGVVAGPGEAPIVIDRIALVELNRRGIRGIAWAWPVIAFDEFGIKNSLVHRLTRSLSWEKSSGFRGRLH